MSFVGLSKLAPPGYKWEKVKVTQVIADGPECYPWKEMYAWLPVRTVSGKIAWRKTIYKRKVYVVWGTGFHMEPVVQYATDFDLIQGYEELIGKERI